MPSTVKVRVIEARDLPVMDRNIQGEYYTDAYVDIKFAGLSHFVLKQIKNLITHILKTEFILDLNK